MNLPRTVAFFCAPLLLAGVVSAQVIPNRAAMNGRLNNTVVEDFESYNVPVGSAGTVGHLALDENTVSGDGQGPGLVLDGCSYSCNFNDLQWNGRDYWGAWSQNILTLSPDGILTLTYDTPVTVIGFDMSALQGWGDSAIVTVYNGSGSVIYTSSPISVPGPSPVFFGYSAASIGKVTIDSQALPWGTLIDNNEYGGSGGPQLAKNGTCPGAVTLKATACTAGGQVAILYGPAGSFTKNGNPCNGLVLGISNPTLGAMLNANGAGAASLSFNAPPGACGRTVQGVDVTSCQATNSIVL